MLGDTAIAVHPEDPRYAKFVGKTARHPFVDRDLIIVADDFVDREFGTGLNTQLNVSKCYNVVISQTLSITVRFICSGAVKITPAHDPNDYDCGKRNNLEFVTVIDEDGLMMDNCGIFSVSLTV